MVTRIQQLQVSIRNSCRWIICGIVDFAVQWVAPLVNIVSVISGGMLTYPLESVKKTYPNWKGLFNLIESTTLFWLFISSVLLSAVLSVVASFRQRSLGEMEIDLKNARLEIAQIGNNIRFVFDGFLLGLAKKLAFSQGDQTRISLYIHDKNESCFIPCGRYSPNPEFKKPGRTEYPDNQGCIAKGWQAGWHFDAGFPADPAQHATYCENNYGIPKAIHDKMKMKSLLYATKQITDPLGDNLGVMVIESMDNGRFQSAQLQHDLEGVIVDLAQMIRTLRNHIPSPTDATKLGL